ncbi:MAG: LUD domain-containing protein [Chloroflexi bacterium]|nr:LUD domain-containing protein [Chloroflexota bacterium]
MREEILLNIRRSLESAMGLPTLPRALAIQPIEGRDVDSLITQFEDEWKKLSGVFVCASDGVGWTLNFLRERNVKRVIAWDEKFLPVKGLHDALKREGIEIVDQVIATGDRLARVKNVAGAEVGITAAEAASAEVGALVLNHGAGRGRLASVIAPIHIAFIRRDQFYPSLENCWAKIDSTASNTVVIAGPSRTSDIERVLVVGAHGPKVVIAVCLE